MKRLILSTLLLVACALGATAQNELYIYQHSGVTDTLQLGDVAGIRHLRTGLDGRQHDDYVVMSVAMQDETVRSYLLADLDSVVMARDGARIRLTRFVGGSNVNGDGTLRNKKLVPLKTSMDGDFMASASTVDFYWEDGDNIYIRPEKTVMTADSVFIRTAKETAEFYFKSGNISGEEVTVYYPGQAPPSTDGQKVRVKSNQSQDVSNTTVHIGTSGDCGTAVARKPEGKSYYYFDLEHKAAYLCFLPYIANDLGRTVLKKVTVRSDKAIAGVFDLTTDGLTLASEDNEAAHTITLTTGGNAGFVLPKTANQSTSAYMVIAPQATSTRLTCEFTVYDTVLESEGVYTKMIDLTEIAPNMVYVIKANCNNYVVDLGLPVKFLNHNMGAFAPEDYGGYYAYGELNDKGNYTSGNYTYQSVAVKDMPHEIRLTEKDVAHMRLGLNFSMPTNAEMRMLTDSCTWTWTTLNGHNGYKVKGKNDNYLFLPAAGYRNGTGNNEITTRGLYRTSTLTPFPSSKRNWYLNFYSNRASVEQSENDIWLGESVRPVISSGVQMTDGTVVQVMTDSVQWKVTELNATLFATLFGYDKAKDQSSVEVGFVVGTSEYPTIDTATKLTVAGVSADGQYSAAFTMPDDTEYFYRAYVKTAGDSISYGNQQRFGRTYVDLGLPSGTKWANINVGAESPDQDGDYYAYGELETKSSYTADNNKWYKSGTWLFPDGQRNIQATADDVASVKWKGVWMLPTETEINELLAHTTATSTTMNGMKGFVLKSKHNDNSIFVTKSAWLDNGVNNYGYYTKYAWFASANLRSNRNEWACCWHKADGDAYNENWGRKDGIVHRPVYKTNATAANGKPMYVRTLAARKTYDGTTETNKLRGVIRGLESAGSDNTYGFTYWKHGDNAHAVTVVSTPDADGYIETDVTGLLEGTTYHYVAYINNGTDDAFHGDTLDITTVGVVDLGLSVKWANVNLGAESEGAGGDFYRWGAKTPYRNTAQQYSLAQDITPESGYDIATNLWGTAYRMPTFAEYEELVANTTRTWVQRNGYWGCLFTSTKEGYTDKTLFLPAAGYYQYDDSYHANLNVSGEYWPSTTNDTGKAKEFNFGSDVACDLRSSMTKAYGFSVRPVQEKLAYVETLKIGRYLKGETEVDTLKAYVSAPSGTVTVGFEFSEHSDMSNAVSYTVGTYTTGVVKYTLPTMQKGKTYYYRAYVTDGTARLYGKILDFELVDYVDLGLPSGTLWANINVGGNASEWYGDYFAYGETQPKESYTQANCTTYGKELGYDIAGTEYDAATVNWGDLWSSPTYDQCNELMNSNNTSLEAVTINGYNCWKVTSKIEGYTDKYILMPRGGRRSGMGYYETPGDDAVFAPSTRYNTSYCYDFFLRADNNRWIGYNYRWYGYTMRPVVNSRNLVKAAGGTLINVRTEGCDLTVGGTTATLHGRAFITGSVSGVTYGFVVGDSTNIDAAANIGTLYPLSNMDNDRRFTMPCNFDGSKKYFRAYLKVGDTYYQGGLKRLTPADLIDVEFLADGTVVNVASAPSKDSKEGRTDAYRNDPNSIPITYNNTYKRWEADFSQNPYASTDNVRYNIDYGWCASSKLLDGLRDGHTIEMVAMLPNGPANNNEANAFANAVNGGTTIGVRDRKFYSAMNIGGSWRYIFSNVVPEAGRYYHVVTVYDQPNNQMRIYVDGVLSGTLDVSGVYDDADNPWAFMVGCEPGNGPGLSWNGHVVVARLYSDILTQEQIATLYEKIKD